MTYTELLRFCETCRRLGLKTLWDVKNYTEATGTSPRDLTMQGGAKRLLRSVK